MRPIQTLYRDFCLRIAGILEDEANAYAGHPQLQDEDQQFIRVLREKCHEWKREVDKLDRYCRQGA